MPEVQKEEFRIDAEKEDRESFFTVVFAGDARDFPGNLFHVDTPFGRPVAIGLGNALRNWEDADV